MRLHNRIILGFVVALAIAPAVSAQRRGVHAESGVAIALQVGGQAYQFEGEAACQHAPVAYIYDAPAEMWSVQQSDGRRSITLTLWRLKNMSSDMFSLGVAVGGKSHLVSTVKIGGGGTVRGSGRVILTPSNPGGTFTINATGPDGAAISGTIKCSAFTAAMAEGG